MLEIYQQRVFQIGKEYQTTSSILTLYPHVCRLIAHISMLKSIGSPKIHGLKPKFPCENCQKNGGFTMFYPILRHTQISIPVCTSYPQYIRNVFTYFINIGRHNRRHNRRHNHIFPCHDLLVGVVTMIPKAPSQSRVTSHLYKKKGQVRPVRPVTCVVGIIPSSFFHIDPENRHVLSLPILDTLQKKSLLVSRYSH